MNRCWLCAFALLSSAAWGESKPPLIVFELEAKGATALQAQAATQGVVRGVRELDVFQVLSADDVHNLLAIERTRQLIGQEAGGVEQISKALGAQHAIVGSVTRVGDKLQVEIRLLDTQKQTVLSQKTLGPMDKMDQVAAELPGLSQELLGPLLLEQQGSLTVQTSEAGSEVLVDGQLVGSTPMKIPLALSRGQHRLQVRKDGFIEQSRPVRIETKLISTENFLMMPSPDYAEAWKQRHGRLRVGAYIATAVALGTLTGAYIMGSNVTVPTYQQKFVPLQYALKEQPLPSQYATPDAQAKWQQCGVDQVTCKTQAQQVQSTLVLDEAVTIGLGAVGLAAAGAATYLWLTGEDPNRYSKLIASVSVTPNGGGITLTGHF